MTDSKETTIVTDNDDKKDTTTTSTDNNNNNNNNRIETDDGYVIIDGKRYRKRHPNKKENIGDLLAYGPDLDPNKKKQPRTWWELIAGPLVFSVLFFLSFMVFLHAPRQNKRRHKISNYGMNSRNLQFKEQQIQMMQHKKKMMHQQQNMNAEKVKSAAADGAAAADDEL